MFEKTLPGYGGEVSTALAALRCSGCKSEAIHRSHRVGLSDKLYSFVSLYPYRCQSCKKRSYHPNRPDASPRRQERIATDAKSKRRLILLFAASLLLFLLFAWKFILAPPAQSEGQLAKTSISRG